MYSFCVRALLMISSACHFACRHYVLIQNRRACVRYDFPVQMLAMSCLDAVLSMDRHRTLLMFLTAKGYLQHVVGSILHDDDQLQTLLTPGQEPLKALYIFESKMVSDAVFIISSHTFALEKMCRLYDCFHRISGRILS